MGLVGFIMLFVIIKKGLKYIGINLGVVEGYVFFIVIVVVVVIIGKFVILCFKIDFKVDKKM